jgi:aromatic ring-cleaving dioxygenase
MWRQGIYRIKFYDHALGEEPAIMNVVGWLIEESKTSVILSHWLMDTDDRDEQRDNMEFSCILKNCIIKKKRLSP